MSAPESPDPILEDRPDARYGEPGACNLCRRSVLTHFDKAGRWAGCLDPRAEGKLLNLVQMGAAVRTGVYPAVQPPARVAAPPAAPATGNKRRFVRSAYAPTVAPGTDLEAAAGDSKHRQEILVHMVRAYARNGHKPLLARDIITKLRKSHGIVQNALIYFQRHGVVEAREAER